MPDKKRETLLGLIRETDGAASSILAKQGLTQDSVREVIAKLASD